MRASSSVRGRHAECAYLLDRAVKNPASTHEFAHAALDAIRLALRPAYAAAVCHVGSGTFHCGDLALKPDIDATAAALVRAPRSLLAQPSSIRRKEAASLALVPLEAAMTAAALELVFPVTDGAALLGVVAIGPRADRKPYSADDVEFLDRIGARLAAVAARDAMAAQVDSLRAAVAGSERLASVGRMAAGLAHEIRNPLVSIRTFTQLLPERHADEEFRNGFLDLTLAEIDRISALVGEILCYARPADAGGRDPDDPGATDVSESVGRTCVLLRSHARSTGVSLDFRGDELAERAAIDEDKLRQVVINLVVNGIQACDGRGRVRVGVSAETCAEAVSRIVVEIHDDGPGMTNEVASRIFEPFFTTRREGTGLGLALVKKILDEAGASITVMTAPGAGTTFRIALLPESHALRAVDGGADCGLAATEPGAGYGGIESGAGYRSDTANGGTGADSHATALNARGQRLLERVL